MTRSSALAAVHTVGCGFVSRDTDLWVYQRGMVLDLARPDKPTYNAFIPAFNGRFCAECLNQRWFLTFRKRSKS